MTHLLTALLLASFTAPAHAAALLVEVAGLDDCCAPKVVAAFEAVPGVSGVAADHVTGRVCLDLGAATASAALIDAASAAVIAAGFQTRSTTATDSCPAELMPAARDPWAGATGLDMRVISSGEEVDLGANAAAGKVTIYEFGARWCGPCWDVAATLTDAMRSRPNLAVRAIELGGTDARASFETPVAKQHLTEAPGIPYLLVKDSRGRTIYRGSDAAEAVAAADRKLQ
jgi:hypothetical protein